MVAERPMTARLDLGLRMTSAVAVIALGLLAILSRGFRQRVRWALGVTTVTILVLFQWPTLTFVGNIIRHLTGVALLADVTPVLIAVALLWLATRLGDEWLFAVIVGVGIVAMTLRFVFATIPFLETGTAVERGQADADAPDVILLILDGYTRADILTEQFGADNTAFVEDLERLGFDVADRARANYGFTYAALATMFNQDYVYNLGPVTPSDEVAMRNALSGSPVMFNRFRTAGYEIAYTEDAWQGSHCGTSVDICIRDGLFQRVLWDLGQVTILAPIQKTVQAHPFNSVAIEQLESLPSYVLADRTEGVPRLTVAHIILPHPPFLRDADCNYVTSPVRRAFATPSEDLLQNRRQYYMDQTMCTNRKVIDALEEIVAARPDIVVMITADHGSASTRMANVDASEWSDTGLQERMSILSAYRLPGCESRFYDRITPVNGSRIITSCATGEDLELLPDLNLWAPATGRGTVTDVSSRLDD
jgi:hypothetical protein